MNDIFRIIDRIKIIGKGTVYITKLSKGVILKAGEFLFDLHGNKFKVVSIDMPTSCYDFKCPIEELSIGIMFELINGVEVQGNILVREITNVSFLFCNHPLYSNKVDDDYQEEYQYASLNYTCALFSYEEFLTGRLKLYGKVISGLTIYRGWMMKPEMYQKLYDALEQKGIYLINTPQEYQRYHLLPGWYNDFKDDTIASEWTIGNSVEDVLEISKKMYGAYIIKDYVKSRKHEWYDACFVKNIQDKKNLQSILTNFISRQGENLVGGIVLRKYESLKHIGYHEQSGMPLSEEYRVFVYGGRILAIDDYWTKKANINVSEEEYKWIESFATRVKSNFVTIDIARKENGLLVIMEFGDGQVSGLQQIKADVFYKAFKGINIHNP